MLLVDSKTGLPISASQLRKTIREFHHESLSILEFSFEEQREADESLAEMSLGELIELAKFWDLLEDEEQEVANV
jgi:hypothetical protein